MRLSRMATGRRVSGQACVSAATRCQRGSAAGRSDLCIAQVAHFAGLRPCGGGLFHVACGLQPYASANRAGPIWHVYPKGARRVALWIFVGCGAAGRGILKDPKAEERSLDCAPFLRQGKRDDERKEPAGGQRYKKRNDEIHSCRRASCVGGDFAQGDPSQLARHTEARGRQRRRKK